MHKNFLFFLFPLYCFSQNWSANFEDAKKQAEETNKPVLIVFSGSDWCAPCIKLEKQLWQTEQFKVFSDTSLILYKADFPKKKSNLLSKTIKDTNEILAQKFNKNGFFPFIVLIDKNEKILGVLGYENLQPEGYIKKIKAIL